MKKRIITVALVVALLATCFAGTYAFLTDTKAVKNTFTAGNVYITLEEPSAPTENKYHLIPGNSYAKDPIITLNKGSEDAWIAAKITFTDYNAYDLLEGGVLKTDAVQVVKAGDVVYVYVKESKKAEATIKLFESLVVPETYDNAKMLEIHGMIINVEAFAVQANGFDNCVSAMQIAFASDFPAATSTPANP